MPKTVDLPRPDQKDSTSVELLVGELQQTKRERFGNIAASLTARVIKWDQRVRLLREVETERFYGPEEPTKTDRTNHWMLLNSLIGLGRMLELEAVADVEAKKIGSGSAT